MNHEETSTRISVLEYLLKTIESSALLPDNTRLKLALLIVQALDNLISGF